MSGMFHLEPGAGLMVAKEGLTTRWVNDPNVEKTDEGLYIDELRVAQNIRGKIDGHTVILTGLNENRQGLLGINHGVVSCCYSLCAYKMEEVVYSDNTENIANILQTTDGTSKSTQYKPITGTVKDINDIRDALNLVTDTYNRLNTGLPMGMPVVQYKPQEGDFITLRHAHHEYIYKMPTFRDHGDTWKVWPTFTEDLNRYMTDVIYAMFYVEHAEWNRVDYLTKLVLRCVWSSLDPFVAGYKYGSPNPITDQEIVIPVPSVDPSPAFTEYLIDLEKGRKTYKIEGTTVSDFSEIPADGKYTVIDEKTINDTRYYRLKSDELGWVDRTKETVQETLKGGGYQAGSLIEILEGATYSDGSVVPPSVRSQKWWVESVLKANGQDCVNISFNETKSGGWAINSNVPIKYVKIVSPST